MQVAIAGRRARREAALRPRLQHHRAAARAHPGRRQRHAWAAARSREIEVKAAARRAARARARHPRRGRARCASSNLLLPSGNLRAGDRDYNVFSNTQFARGAAAQRRRRARGPAQTPADRAAPRCGSRDVAEVEDGTADQNEIVRINGRARRLLPRAQAAGRQHHRRGRRGPRRAAQPARRPAQRASSRSPSTSRRTSARPCPRCSTRRCRAASSPSLVILFFLVSLRATGIVAVAIPLSIVATFVLLYFTGQTLNVFTLGGLALGVGRLVDDSIVELENIHRHLALGQRPQAGGARRGAGSGDAHLRLDHHHHRGLLPGALPGRGSRGILFLPAGAHHRLRAHHELLRLAHGDAAPLPLLAARAGDTTASATGIAGAITRRLERLDDAYARALRWVAAPPRASRCSSSSRSSSRIAAAPQEDRHGVLPRHRRGRSSASSTRRPSARASSGPSRSPSASRRSSTRRSRRTRDTTAHAHLHDDDLRHRAARRPHRALHRQHRPHAGNLQVNLVAAANRPISDVEADREGARRAARRGARARRSSSSSAAS